MSFLLRVRFSTGLYRQTYPQDRTGSESAYFWLWPSFVNFAFSCRFTASFASAGHPRCQQHSVWDRLACNRRCWHSAAARSFSGGQSGIDYWQVLVIIFICIFMFLSTYLMRTSVESTIRNFNADKNGSFGGAGRKRTGCTGQVAHHTRSKTFSHKNHHDPAILGP